MERVFFFCGTSKQIKKTTTTTENIKKEVTTDREPEMKRDTEVNEGEQQERERE